MPKWIKYPTTTTEKNEIKKGFFEKWGVRGVVGSIDGTHVEIKAPPISDKDHPPFVYMNRHGHNLHSINVMLISDSNCKIIACCAKFPGSSHDSAIWKMSNIRIYLKNMYFGGDKNTHLIGDKGYPLEPWLFTPLTNPQPGTPEYRYNDMHKTARNVIERTNGILKGRFWSLSRFKTLQYHPTRAANIIYTAATLHNMALSANIPIDEDNIEYRDENDSLNNNAENDPNRENNVYQLGQIERRKYIEDNCR